MKLTLNLRQRRVGAEAPSAKVYDAEGALQVIGMIAVKRQVLVYQNEFVKADCAVLQTEKTITYVVNASTDRDHDFAKRFGLLSDEGVVANAIFVVDTEGVIEYMEVCTEAEQNIDCDKAIAKIAELNAIKKKGHSHENWMKG